MGKSMGMQPMTPIFIYLCFFVNLTNQCFKYMYKILCLHTGLTSLIKLRHPWTVCETVVKTPCSCLTS